MVHIILIFLPVVCSCVIKYLFMSPLVVCLSCEVCTFWSYALIVIIIRSTLQGVCNPWLRGFSSCNLSTCYRYSSPHAHVVVMSNMETDVCTTTVCIAHSLCISRAANSKRVIVSF